MFDSHGGGYTPEIIPPGNDGDAEEIYNQYNLQGTIIEFYDCFQYNFYYFFCKILYF